MSLGHTKLGAGLVEIGLREMTPLSNANASVAFHGVVVLLHDLQGADQLGPSCELHPIFGKK
jgi:hypothetical protein